jgi:lipopolysaccharide assembly outer membrane protein LptD (OstA)
MKLTVLAVLMACTPLAFSQNLQTQMASPSGTVTLSAQVMLQERADGRAEREKLTALRQLMAELTSRYKSQHPSVINLQAQIDALEAARKAGSQVIHLKGAVEIRTSTTTVLADEAFYHPDTGDIEASGNVRITPVSRPAN